MAAGSSSRSRSRASCAVCARESRPSSLSLSIGRPPARSGSQRSSRASKRSLARRASSALEDGMADKVPHDTTAGEAGQVVRAPEQVALYLPVAGPTSRMLAYAIDYVVILLLQLAAMVLLVLAAPFVGRMALDAFYTAREHPERIQELVLTFLGLFLVIQLAIEWGYFVFCEMTTGGRSLGKALVGLRAVRDGGVPISLRESPGRNLPRTVDAPPRGYTLWLVSIVPSRDGQR